MANQDIRIAIIQANLKYYEIAHKLGIFEQNFSKKLRYELSKEEKEKLLKIIEELKKERSK